MTRYTQTHVNTNIIGQDTRSMIKADDNNEIVALPEMCKGLTRNGKPCEVYPLNKRLFCEKNHKIFETYSDQQVQKYLEIPRENLKPCKQCKNYRPMCEDGEHCVTCEPNLLPLCCGILANGKPCHLRAMENSKVCGPYHHDMHEYTDEQFQKIAQCFGCKKYRAIVDKKKCSKCAEKQTMNKEKRNERKKCIGRQSNANGDECEGVVIEGRHTCPRHRDMENYTEEMCKNIRKCPLCQSCRPKWRYFEGDGCNWCLKRKKEKEYHTTCGDSGGLMMDGSKCGAKPLDGTKFCKIHKDLVTYTQEMLDNQKLCSTKKHYRYCGEYHTCKKCRDTMNARYKKNRSGEKCKKCENQRVNGDYCGLHYVDYYKEFAAAKNLKTCANVNRACKALLPLDYNRGRCGECLLKNRIYERKKYESKKQINNALSHNQ
jgi:hypothetical protein